MVNNTFHKKLRFLIIEYIKSGYHVLDEFPPDERFGMTSQCKRALVSIFLNYTEGYARISKGITKNLYEVAYGSLHESISVFFLGVQLTFISETEYLPLFEQKEEIAKMLWKSIDGLTKDRHY